MATMSAASDPHYGVPAAPAFKDDSHSHEMTTFLPLATSPSRGSTTPTPKPIKRRPVPSAAPRATQYVTWGIGWRVPLTMALFFTSGVIVALAHHFYYSGLDGCMAGDQRQQQWVIWLGTGFTFFTLFLLNMANGIAFTQYAWRLVNLYALSIEDINKLFSATVDITAFFSLALWRRGWVAMGLAFLLWCMALTTVVPPGSITIVAGGLLFQNQTMNVSTFGWSNVINGHSDCGILYCKLWPDGKTVMYPNPVYLKLASQVAESVTVWDIPHPAPNSTFSMTFFGPALQCNPATESQQVSFDYYNQAVYDQIGSLTGPQLLGGKHGVPNGLINNSNFHGQLIYFTAFSPQFYGIVNDMEPLLGVPDLYNNWKAALPPGVANYNNTLAELWVQTANESIVCGLWNASYLVGFDYPNGIQNITSRNLTYFNQWTSHLDDSQGGTNYEGMMASLMPMLYGNVTVLGYPCTTATNESSTCYFLSDTSSRVLSSGIAACDEFTHSFWNDHVTNKSLQYSQPDNSFNAYPRGQCRNRTVARAIEDLAANLTISMLGTSLGDFIPSFTAIPVMTYASTNIYSYDGPSLLASYGAAIAVSLLVLLVGAYALLQNGISRDASFGAFLTATRNPDLDRRALGQSFGPMDKSLARTKLRFGALLNAGAGLEGEGAVKTAAFGVEGSLERLRRRGRYV